MGEDGFRQWKVERHEHRGPVDGMGREDILPDKMDIGRPESICQWFPGRRYSNAETVIHQRVEPDIGDVVIVERQFDAPGEP